MADPVTTTVAFGAGLVSFFAPCVLPVVPGYLAFVTGGMAVGRTTRIMRTVAFVLGFGIAFTILGALVGALGGTPAFQRAETWVQRIGGALIIVFGLHMTGLLRLKFLDRDVRYHGHGPKDATPLFSALALGAAFGVGWSPCVGPVLASILLLAGLDGGAAGGALLLAVYSAGLGVPFLVIGFSAERSTAVLQRFRRTTIWIERVGGGILIVLGIFVFTGSLTRVISYVI